MGFNKDEIPPTAEIRMKLDELEKAQAGRDYDASSQGVISGLYQALDALLRKNRGQ